MVTERPTVPLLCPHGTVVCLGGGPSLTVEDVAAVRDQVDLVIAINDAHRLAPWAEVLYSSDQRWWEHYKGVPTFSGLKFGIHPLVARDDWNVTVLGNSGDAGIEPDPTALKNGRNSGAAAINLAVHLGATRVLLLGYDLGHRDGSPSHWFGEHPPVLRSRSPYATFIEMFRLLVTPLEQLGVTVINCSRQTALECFPRQSLHEALGC